VGALVFADVVQQLIGRLVAGRAPVQVADLVVFGCLTGSEQAVHRGDPRLHAQPARESHRGRVRDRDAQLGHPGLQPAAMAALRRCHAVEDVGLVCVHPRGDQLVDRGGLDLSAPSFEQAFPNLR
jgi:hypothetical protein